jgi:hypothetical protein
MAPKKSKATARLKKRFLKQLRKYGSTRKATQALRIYWHRPYNWRARDPDFKRNWDLIKQQLKVEREQIRMETKAYWNKQRVIKLLPRIIDECIMPEIMEDLNERRHSTANV